jgi:hypothetical protein
MHESTPIMGVGETNAKEMLRSVDQCVISVLPVNRPVGTIVRGGTHKRDQRRETMELSPHTVPAILPNHNRSLISYFL